MPLDLDNIVKTVGAWGIERERSRASANAAEAQAQLAFRQQQQAAAERAIIREDRAANERQWLIWGVGLVTVLFLVRATDRG